jgi:hypothetical protein
MICEFRSASRACQLAGLLLVVLGAACASSSEGTRDAARPSAAGTAPREIGAETTGLSAATAEPVLDPRMSLYPGAYDGQTLPREELVALFERPPSTIEWHVDRRKADPDDIRVARELGLIDDRLAQHLANESLDALERASVPGLPERIRYTHAGPFYFRLRKDDSDGLDRLLRALGLDPEARNTQRTHAGSSGWDDAALQALRDEGRLRVVDRFRQDVDIFSTTEVDGRPERLVNLKLVYRASWYEPDPDGSDARRAAALDGDHLMIEAWNRDLSRPDTAVVYEIPSYEYPRFNEGNLVDIHSDDTRLWRFETLREPDGRGRARVGFASATLDLVRRGIDRRGSRWARNGGVEKVRYRADQTPAGNQAMVAAGMRAEDWPGPYARSPNRYNGGHVIAASLGGMGEGINVTAQAEGNNQDRTFDVALRVGERQLDLTVTETWHDWERYIKHLCWQGSAGLSLETLQAVGLRPMPGATATYGMEDPVPYRVHVFIRVWYEDEGLDDEPPDSRHTRELARFTTTEIHHRATREVLARFEMANYNVGGSDEDHEAKMQMLFDAGLLDRDGAYPDDLVLAAFRTDMAYRESPPDVQGGGTTSESLPTVAQLRSLVRAPGFREVWGPNMR